MVLFTITVIEKSTIGNGKNSFLPYFLLLFSSGHIWLYGGVECHFAQGIAKYGRDFFFLRKYLYNSSPNDEFIMDNEHLLDAFPDLRAIFCSVLEYRVRHGKLGFLN